MSRCLDLNRGREAAIRACTTVIESPRAWSSEIAKAYARRGWLYVNRGLDQKGDDDYRAVFQSWGGENGRRAIADFERAITLDPPAAAEAFAGRAGYSFVQGKYDRAINDFTVAINSNPPKDWLCNSLLERGYSYQMAAMI